MSALDDDAEFERLELGDGAWVDICRGWIAEPDELFATLRDGVAWETGQLFRYDHYVEENRLGAGWRVGSPLPHPVLADAHRRLQHRYRVRFGGFSMIQYRGPGDGQAFHRDTDMRWLDDTLIAVLSLGAARPWLLRPRAHRHSLAERHGATHDLAPGAGDLLVMGGTCQANWEHSVPYLTAASNVGVRISLQWRWTSRQGRPFRGGSFGDSLHYSPDRR